MIANRCHTNLAANLLKRIDDRKSKLIENEVMLCAIYLDPRFKKDLDNNQEKAQFAQVALKNIWKHMQSLKEPVNDAPIVTNMPSHEKSQSRLADFFDELDEMDEQCTSLNLQNDHLSDEIEIAIHQYESFVKDIRLKSKDSVHAFWDTNKENLGPVLYKVACAVFAVPPTQASVERTFSALKYLFSDSRYRLSESTLETLMLVHTNADLYYLIKEIELKHLFEN